MKYYIIAGEASGDLHGANLIKALIKEDPDAEFRVWGGDLMNQVSGALVKHYKDLAFMGFLEVILNLRTIFRNLSFCKQDIQKFKPDTLIFIDYPGFNLRIAKWARLKGYQTHYYISPQLWAWKENRINAIKRDVDFMYVILPFEKEFYNKHGYSVNFVGHPLLDELKIRKPLDEASFKQKHKLNNLPIIALLPGSRKQEIKKMLRVMLQMVDCFPEYQFVIAGAPSQTYNFYLPYIKQYRVTFVSNATYDLLSLATAALVTSGTATLEAALFKVPEVVCYKGSWLSYQIGKRLVSLKFISLVNLIMNKEVVTELIQNQLNSTSLKQELTALLRGKKRENILENYQVLPQKLGGAGASKKTANLIYKRTIL